MSPLTVLRTVSIVFTVLMMACYAYQVIYLFLPLVCKRKPHKSEKLHRYAILIAARNEEAVLPHLLQSIRAQDYPDCLITTYVVADNCTDRTAQVAARAGATVFERFNRRQVGKGYALQYLLQRIPLAQHDAFLIVDADNLLAPDYISQINRVCSDGYQAFCGYRNTKNFGTNWVCASHSLWYLHDSTHLSQSRDLVGLPCAVTGTGFGFTRSLLEQLGGWNFFTLTEDIEFSVWCATRGIRVGYCHDAILYDEQPESFHQSFRQRIRWTQGTFQVSFRYGWALLRGLFKGGRTSFACLESLSLSLWGYLLGILCAGLNLLTSVLLYGWLGALQWLVCSLLGMYFTGLCVAGLTVLTEHKRIRATRAQKLRSVFTFPLYLLSYIPIFVAAIFCKPQWRPIAHTHALSAEELHGT